MKKYLLSLIFIVTPLLASAQESLYESLVNEEKTWTMLSVGSTYPTSYWHQIYELKGDTLIDNLHFKKIVVESSHVSETDMAMPYLKHWNSKVSISDRTIKGGCIYIIPVTKKQERRWTSR